MKDSAFESFGESAQDALDFARCQRPDGSFYGTSGQCRKGSPTGAKEKAAAKSKASKAADKTEQLRQINTQEGRGGGVGKGGRSPVGKTGVVSTKELQATAKSLDKAAKAADKKADAADKKFQKSKSPADQKAAKAADKEAKAANKAADKADKAFQKSSKESGSAAKPKASPEEKAAKQLKSAKSKLQMEAKGLKEMRDIGIKDNRIDQAASRVRIAKQKLESLRDKAAKKAGAARPEKSSMTTRIAREERDIRRQAGAGSAKAKQYTDLKKRIQEGKVGDPISARRQLSQLRSELKPASPNQ